MLREPAVSTPPMDISALIVQLADPDRRADGAEHLARHLGVDRVILLVCDVRLKVLLPAAGMPQTLAGGALWRRMLRECLHPGKHRTRIDLPVGHERDAMMLAAHGSAMVLVGGMPHDADCAQIMTWLPLLDALLVAEHRASDAQTEAAAALARAVRANSLADALEVARAEAARLNAQLREEHERKDDFLAMLAHELRNPLAPITHSVEILRSPRITDAIRKRQLDVVARQAQQLSRLIEDLLDVSRVSRGRIDLRRTQIDLREILQTSVDTTRPLIEARRHALSVELSSAALLVDGDGDRLTQVFSNLLNNAAKYTEPGGQIRIEAGLDGDAVVVSVSDTGIGIQPQMLRRVFDLFTQAPVALDRAQGGLGIGLTLVRSLVEMHHGTVRADSRGTGCGSTFTVHLPLSTARMRPEVAAVEPPRPRQRRVRVLVVDDNLDAADALGHLLRLDGHEALLAHSGPGALQIVDELVPDIVLLDIGLPELDGFEVARRMRSRFGNRVRLVALTGYGSNADRDLSREAGFDEHWVKPISAVDLQRIVASAVAPAHSPNEGK